MKKAIEGDSVFAPPEIQDDEELEKVVREIFNIIPSYYHKGQAQEIANLIKGYTKRKLEQRE